METLQLIFRIGIILGIFGFIWTLFRLALILLFPAISGMPQSNYLIRAIQYVFIVQTTLLFCYEKSSHLSLNDGSIGITAMLLLFYFISKLHRRKRKNLLFKFMNNGQEVITDRYSKLSEWGLIGLGIFFFIICLIQNQFIYNPITIWIQQTIIGIEKAPLFGFIFQIFGFFFVLNVLTKSITAIFNLFKRQNQEESNEDKEDDKFDDFEEIK
jgi:hypothetical protein